MLKPSLQEHSARNAMVAGIHSAGEPREMWRRILKIQEKGELCPPLWRKMSLVLGVIVGDRKGVSMSVSSFDGHAHPNSWASIVGPFR